MIASSFEKKRDKVLSSTENGISKPNLPLMIHTIKSIQRILVIPGTNTDLNKKFKARQIRTQQNS